MCDTIVDSTIVTWFIFWDWEILNLWLHNSIRYRYALYLSCGTRQTSVVVILWTLSPKMTQTPIFRICSTILGHINCRKYISQRKVEWVEMYPQFEGSNRGYMSTHFSFHFSLRNIFSAVYMVQDCWTRAKYGNLSHLWRQKPPRVQKTHNCRSSIVPGITINTVHIDIEWNHITTGSLFLNLRNEIKIQLLNQRLRRTYIVFQQIICHVCY